VSSYFEVGAAHVTPTPPVALFCSVLQCVTVCCSVLQCVAECCSEQLLLTMVQHVRHPTPPFKQVSFIGISRFTAYGVSDYALLYGPGVCMNACVHMCICACVHVCICVCVCVYVCVTISHATLNCHTKEVYTPHFGGKKKKVYKKKKGLTHRITATSVVDCSVLQCGAVCCSVLQRVAACCSEQLLQKCMCAAVCCRVLQRVAASSCFRSICSTCNINTRRSCDSLNRRRKCCRLQRVAVCCSVLQYVAVCCSVRAPCDLLNRRRKCCRPKTAQCRALLSLHSTPPVLCMYICVYVYMCICVYVYMYICI